MFYSVFPPKVSRTRHELTATADKITARTGYFHRSSGMETRTNETICGDSVQSRTDAETFRAHRKHDQTLDGAFEQVRQRFQQSLQPREFVALLCIRRKDPFSNLDPIG